MPISLDRAVSLALGQKAYGMYALGVATIQLPGGML
jgi:hypothetical protein